MSPTLLTLPPELRNRVWELVVYHSATDGLICPLQDSHGQIEAGTGIRNDLYKYTDSYILLWGVRFKISRFEPQYPWSLPVAEMQYSSPLFVQTDEEMKELWIRSTMAKSKHFCTLDCLVQPGITRTCTQTRAESLATFYNSNAFHLEMDNFALLDSFKRPHVRVAEKFCPRRSPIDWWRAIGNVNVRRICRFSIAAQSFFAYDHNALVVRYNQFENKS